ncbi:MAG: histidine kinase, partial [Bacteroidales bacterium]
IWAATYGGLNKLDQNTGNFTVYKHIIGDAQSLSTNKVFSITQDAEGVYWIGTMGGGLNSMDPNTGKFSHYVQADGLANNVVYDVIPDRLGYLWMNTNKGLSRFSPRTETFINYDINDGVQSYEFNMGAALKSSQGMLLFGGMNGFNAFYPLEVIENQLIPELVITKINIYNKELPGTYHNGDTLILSHTDNFLSIEFAALDYSNPVKNQYKYKLDDISTEWMHTTADKNVAEFTGLSPGKYVFRLKGTNSDGLWNDKGLEMLIIVKPAWYQTKLFQYGSSSLLLIVVSWFAGFRIRQIRKKQQVQNQLFELEKKALRLQMNPHFIFNTLNSIQSYILQKDNTAAVSYLNQFSKMIRQVLYNSDKSFVLLSDEISLLKSYIELERLRFDSVFDFFVHVDPALDEDFISIPPMLIQPHVENAILHGLLPLKTRKGKLNISFIEQSSNMIKCVVEDNGIGRKAAQEIKDKARNKYKSRGISITKERLQRINKFFDGTLSVQIQDKFDDNGNAEGTRVILVIPVNNT